MSPWLLVLALGILIGSVATGYILDRQTTLSESPPPPERVRVEKGTLGRTLRMPATGAWTVEGVVRAPSGGTITEVVVNSGLLRPGDLVLRIDERPVVVIPGDIPAFRALGEGSRGRDVAAIQAYLATLGFEVDDDPVEYSSVTTTAVRAWQESLGILGTGRIRLGDVLLLPEAAFAAPVRWTDSVAVGATTSPGMPILERLAPAPTLTVSFGGSPPAQLEPGTPGDVAFPGGGHRSIVMSMILESLGSVTATLDPPAGALCEPADCLALVSVSGETPLDVTFTVVPQTTGPIVPVAALQSDPAGRAFVVRPNGERVLVTVRVASGGLAVVEGIDVGEEILLLP
jgi:hypothetical protein